MAAIVAFGSAVVPTHYRPILGPAAAQAQLDWWGEQRMASAVAAGRVHLAVLGDAVVGVVETGAMGGEQVIWKLYVEPRWRGRSLGVRLLERAVAALPDGTRTVLVEHFAGNTRAGAFYEREGFGVVRTEAAESGDAQATVVWRRLELPDRLARSELIPPAPADAC